VTAAVSSLSDHILFNSQSDLLGTYKLTVTRLIIIEQMRHTACILLLLAREIKDTKEYFSAFLAYFLKVGLCDLLPLCVSICLSVLLCVPPMATRQRGLLFDERERPFSIGALTGQSRRTPPPPTQTETEYCLF
jgi:hypothetical protein